MKLHVLKNPRPGTLAEVREVADDAPAPAAPWEEMSVAAFEAWRDAQPPAALSTPLRQSTRIVLDRLTPAEAQALAAAEASSWQIRMLVMKALSAGEIHEDDPDFPAARAALAQLDVIAAERWPALLAP